MCDLRYNGHKLPNKIAKYNTFSLKKKQTYKHTKKSVVLLYEGHFILFWKKKANWISEYCYFLWQIACDVPYL